MPKAVWNNAVLAESDTTIEVDGKHYFPRESVVMDHLQDSDTRSVCPWKGTAVYYHVRVGDSVLTDAAWSYRDPSAASANVRDHVAFWKGVEVEE